MLAAKMWITNGPGCRHLRHLCQDRSGRREGDHRLHRQAGTSGGFSTAQKLDKLGMRGSSTCELVFDNCGCRRTCWAPARRGQVLMSGLDYERVVLAGRPLASCRPAWTWCFPYVRERKQFGQAIGGSSWCRASSPTCIPVSPAAGRWSIRWRAPAIGGHQPQRIAAAILFAAENATQMALDAIQLLGGNGYINEYPTGRLLRDAKLYEPGAGTSEIRRWLIGRELMGRAHEQDPLPSRHREPRREANRAAMQALVDDLNARLER